MPPIVIVVKQSTAAIFPTGGSTTTTRPAGVAPPLPREIGHSAWFWAAGFGFVVVFWFLFGFIDGFLFWVSERDLEMLDAIVECRSRGATSTMMQMQRVGLWWVVPIIGRT